MSMSKRYGNTRLEQACKHALALGSPRRKSVASLLEKGLESVPLPEKNLTLSLPAHDNIRGPSYYAE